MIWIKNNYIKILWDNIKDTEKDQYSTEPNADTTVPYDAMSLMHYGDNYFSVDGEKKTMLFGVLSPVSLFNIMII